MPNESSTARTDCYSRTWTLPESELCSECGQPSNGRYPVHLVCHHKRLAAEDAWEIAYNASGREASTAEARAVAEDLFRDMHSDDLLYDIRYTSQEDGDSDVLWALITLLDTQLSAGLPLPKDWT